MSVDLVPMTLREAFAFTDVWHRHHRAPQGGLYAIGLAHDDEIVGCVIVGRPVARHLNDGFTAEVTRLTVREGWKDACSRLYGAAWRAARAMGYRRLITYTLATEPGTSLKAAGFTLVGQTKGGSWSRTERPRFDKHPVTAKFRWEQTVP